MRAVVQRVSQAEVTIGGEVAGRIGRGLVVLLAIAPQDTPKQADWLAEKIATLRIFADEAGKMNFGLAEIRGEVLVLSQFTLYGDCQKGRRPSFLAVAPPAVAEPLYRHFLDACRLLGIKTESGRFAADMQVSLTNDGPVTLILDA
jgi:D-aminoacyl-tRNA deacylase